MKFEHKENKHYFMSRYLKPMGIIFTWIAYGFVLYLLYINLNLTPLEYVIISVIVAILPGYSIKDLGSSLRNRPKPKIVTTNGKLINNINVKFESDKQFIRNALRWDKRFIKLLTNLKNTTYSKNDWAKKDKYCAYIYNEYKDQNHWLLFHVKTIVNNIKQIKQNINKLIWVRNKTKKPMYSILQKIHVTIKLISKKGLPRERDLYNLKEWNIEKINKVINNFHDINNYLKNISNNINSILFKL